LLYALIRDGRNFYFAYSKSFSASAVNYYAANIMIISFRNEKNAFLIQKEPALHLSVQK
jgi:hypothetical protein